MPDYRPYHYCTFTPLRERVYHGFYGVTAQSKITASCRRRGIRAVFTDCRSF